MSNKKFYFKNLRRHLDDSQARLPPVGHTIRGGEGSRKGLCGYCVPLLIDKLLIYKDIERDYISCTVAFYQFFFEHYTFLYNIFLYSVKMCVYVISAGGTLKDSYRQQDVMKLPRADIGDYKKDLTRRTDRVSLNTLSP